MTSELTQDHKAPWTRKSTAFLETDKGPTYYDFDDTRVVLLRARPLAAWSIAHREGRVRGRRSLDVDIAGLIREVRVAEAAARGESLATPLKAGPYRVRRRNNFAAWLAHIPRPIQDLVADGWQGDTWAYLRLLMSSPRALEAALTPGGAPFVFALSCAHALLEAAPRRFWPFVERLLRMKRKHALGALGFPALPSSVALLQKIPRAHMGAATLTGLRKALLHKDTLKQCCHASRLSASLVHALDPALLPHMAPSLLEELAHSDEIGWAAVSCAQRLRDTLEMASCAGGHVGVLSSRAELHAAHDAWMHEAQTFLALPKGPLPKPPCALPDALLRACAPLPSFEALREEGQAMHHCLGMLDHQTEAAHAGRFHAFAVSSPERATVALWRPHELAHWQLYDAKGPCNAEVTPLTLRFAARIIDAFERARLASEGAQAQLHLFDPVAP